MYTPNNSVIEAFRKPVSRLAAVVVILAAVFTVPVWFEGKFGETLEMIGYSLLMVAALGRVWCSVYIAGRKDKVLCMEGPYAMTRNPLYFFSFLGVLGLSAALQSLSIMLFSSVCYLAYYYYVITSEEGRLTKLFGDAYREYAKVTPRFFPKLTFGRSDSSYTVNPRVIEREMRDVVGFLAVIIVTELLEVAHHEGYLVLAVLPF